MTHDAIEATTVAFDAGSQDDSGVAGRLFRDIRCPDGVCGRHRLSRRDTLPHVAGLPQRYGLRKQRQRKLQLRVFGREMAIHDRTAKPIRVDFLSDIAVMNGRSWRHAASSMRTADVRTTSLT
jgi:hypothetical protein